MKRLELWGGPECTVARLGERWRDQAAETGHRDRAEDIGLIADLGVKRVRYPILWEKVAPERPDRCDFAWTDARLEALRERVIGVIGGLLHHGSGPAYTNLLDPDFPRKLGDYAARVAERYPWIDLWTPVNEPLTTARFSGLYGHWYPHRRDYRSFLRALVNQCAGTVAAMAAIRQVNPAARLLQTEDLGKTFATAPLVQQALHENQRRWLSFDLLCGRVGPAHPWHRLLRNAGIGDNELERFLDGAGRPDLLGINHYLTSERFLDHRLHLYPGHEIGGNGRDLYVDAEAVRVRRLGAKIGIAARLREAWRRYRLPIAVTEVHHGCTREEQLRWFAEVWQAAETLRGEGVPIEAVTLWSLFGTYDWRSLLTRDEGHYDVGAYDVRAPKPRPTAIAAAAKAFATTGAFDHPVLVRPGWWRRPQRLYPWHGRCQTLGDALARPLLITGATGTLGQALARIAEHRGLPFCLTDRAALDICDAASIEQALKRHQPWAVINAAGFVRVADAEREAGTCFAWNAEGPARLAEACREAGVRLVTFSSDLVFDGADGPYDEAAEVNPQTVYGRSKAEAERRVLEALPDALVVRTSAFFGPWDRYNFAWHVLYRLGRGERIEASADHFVSPTFVPDLCHAVLDLLIDGESGLWHLANQGALSWADFARRVAEGAGYDAGLVRETAVEPPRNNALISRRGWLMRPFEAALRDYLWEAAPAATALAAE